jgi:hypothetical protein
MENIVQPNQRLGIFLEVISAFSPAEKQVWINEIKILFQEARITELAEVYVML